MANMETMRAELDRWMTWPEMDEALLEELRSIESDDRAVEDRFYRQLEFGTGGLRGLLGAGTNRMNRYTVAKATQGLADYLNSLPGAGKSVAIAHDSRHGGLEFTRTAAQVLSANGITAWVYPRLEPTPALSFAVRDLGCDAGICVTASHNPAEYNGYKVYGADGCQITTDAAKAIQAAIDGVDVLSGPRNAADFGLIREIPEDTLDRFLQAVEEQGVEAAGADVPLHVVYTPLNGAGKECVLRILNRIGVEKVTVVPSQSEPDGSFPTCPYPNPEIRQALEEGIQLCREVQPDLLLATDPDCDRVGTAVAENGDYRLITGNEMGILLLDYLCSQRKEKGTMPQQPVAVTTIVSTAMADTVAAAYGVELRRTLTGFKYIGEMIGALEAAGQQDRYLFGFEESYGYLSGGYVRDKDAVDASMLICQMARAYKAKGMTLGQAMDALYEKYGWYQNRLCSFQFPGAEGMREMQALMQRLRAQPPKQLAGLNVQEMVDYGPGVGDLPASDVLEFRLAQQCKLLIRPSGTEPKLKAYVFSRGDSAAQAEQLADALEAAAGQLVQEK